MTNIVSQNGKYFAIETTKNLQLKWQIVSNWSNLLHQALRKQCQNFATALLDHTRSSGELGEIFSYFFHMSQFISSLALINIPFHTHSYPENHITSIEKHWNLSHCEQKRLADIFFLRNFAQPRPSRTNFPGRQLLCRRNKTYYWK